MNCKDCLHKNVCYTVAHIDEYEYGYDLDEFIKRFGCDDYMDYAEWIYMPNRKEEKKNDL